MPSYVVTNKYITINGVDLSSNLESAELTYEAEAVDDTAMGDSVRSNQGGLKVIGLTVTMHQDYAASKVDATLYSIVGTQVAVALKPVNTTTSATNPQYSTTMLVQSYQPISGTVGELSKTQIVFAPAGVALTRATS